jgi:hypothetical protein
MAHIEIRKEELYTPMIDEVLEQEKALSQIGGESVEDVRTPLWLSPVFYYSVAAVIGSLVAWAAFEPFFVDPVIVNGQYIENQTSPLIVVGMVAGVACMIGLLIGLTYGIANRNPRQMLYCSAVSLGATFVASLVGFVLATIVFLLMLMVVGVGVAASGGLGFVLFMCARGLAWGVFGIAAGIGLGVAQRSGKLLFNGIAGGLIGGVLGGLVFDPIALLTEKLGSQGGDISRCIGFSLLALLIGIFIGVFENISKDAWFLMLKGPLAGKQFNIFKSPMIIGSAPKCDVYLFKDPAIEPNHARVLKSGNKYLIEDEGSESGTLINGKRIDRYVLQGGDIITIGETVLKYNERQKR